MSESREVRGFNPDYAGRRAECDGGGAIAGTRLAGRQDYAGTLTGDYIDHASGNAPPWRWYLMRDLTLKPQNCEDEAIWCLAGNLHLID
ncbi:hypothetical protein ACY05_00550 [Sterolibacterium denitrificans]|nr:hypothetical protein [Sterolibacterium denitrificans]KYC29109.1 hypothetical protein ACY05_00550 [Sterolibacterium denitrificans]